MNSIDIVAAIASRDYDYVQSLIDDGMFEEVFDAALQVGNIEAIFMLPEEFIIQPGILNHVSQYLHIDDLQIFINELSTYIPPYDEIWVGYIDWIVEMNDIQQLHIVIPYMDEQMMGYIVDKAIAARADSMLDQLVRWDLPNLRSIVEYAIQHNLVYLVKSINRFNDMTIVDDDLLMLITSPEMLRVVLSGPLILRDPDLVMYGYNSTMRDILNDCLLVAQMSSARIQD